MSMETLITYLKGFQREDRIALREIYKRIIENPNLFAMYSAMNTEIEAGTRCLHSADDVQFVIDESLRD